MKVVGVYRVEVANHTRKWSIVFDFVFLSARSVVLAY